MTRSDQFKSAIMAVIIVLSVISAAGIASAEINQQDPRPVNLIQIDGEEPDIGVINNSNNNDRTDVPRVASNSALTSNATQPSVLLVNINVTDDPPVGVNVTLTTDSADPFGIGSSFGVGGDVSLVASDGGRNDLSTPGSNADGIITVELPVNAASGNFATGQNVSVILSDGTGPIGGASVRTEVVSPVAIVDNREVLTDHVLSSKNDSDPDVFDANNPNPDFNVTSQNDNDADSDSQTRIHAREQAKIASNLTRNGPVEVANVVADISNLSANISRDNQTIPMHFDANEDGRISESEEGLDGPNGTYIGRFYVNDTDAVNSTVVNVTATDTVDTVAFNRSDNNTAAVPFAGLEVGDSVAGGNPPNALDSRTTEPNGTLQNAINYYVYGQEGDDQVTVVFETELNDESNVGTGIFSEDSGVGALSTDDFNYIDNDADTATSVQSVQHQQGSHVAILTLDERLSEDDVVGEANDVGSSPLSDEIRISEDEIYIRISPDSGQIFPLVPDDGNRTDQSIFPTNTSDPNNDNRSVQATPKDPTVNNRSVNPEEQININGTFSVHPYGQDINETQIAVSFRGTDTNERFIQKDAIDDGLIDGAEFSDETERLDGESIVIGRGDRGGEEPDLEFNTTLNLDRLPPGGASGGPLNVRAQAYGEFDSNTIDNATLATDTSVDIDAVRPIVRSATVQRNDASTVSVSGEDFRRDQVFDVTFSEPVQDRDGNTPDRSDFEYIDNNSVNASSVVAVDYGNAERTIVRVAVDSPPSVSDLDEDTLEVQPNQIVDADRVPAATGGFFEVGNTARDGIETVNRTGRIDLQESALADDPAVQVSPDPVKGDDSIIVETQESLTTSDGDLVRLQLEDARGNTLAENITVRDGRQITDSVTGDALKINDDIDRLENGVITTRILLSEINTRFGAAEGPLIVRATNIINSNPNFTDVPDSEVSTSQPIIVDNTRPTVIDVFPSDGNEVTVQFSEGVYARDISRERLGLDEFSFDDNNQGGAVEINDVQHTAGSATATLELTSGFTQRGDGSDQADDEIGFEIDQVEDEAGNSLIPGSESVPVGERQVDDIVVSTTQSADGTTEISARAEDAGAAQPGVSVTFEVTNGDGIFSNGQQSVVKETQARNNIPQSIATLSGNGTVEISAGGETAVEEIGIGDAPPTADVTFNDQSIETGSTSVNVASATFNGDEAFNIVVHQATDSNDNGEIEAAEGEIGTKIGESEELSPGTRTDISVNISKQITDSDSVSELTANQTLIAMLHTTNTSDGDNIVSASSIKRGETPTPVFQQADITVQEEVVQDPANPVIGNSQAPAADINGDGKLEDVNGDGEVSFGDAITLAFNTGDVSGNDSFDFDGDGDVDFDDAIELAFR